MILSKSEAFIVILGRSQTLCLFLGERIYKYHISTAKNGFGEEESSFKTPRGWHYVRAIIGKDNPINSYYRGRRLVPNKTDITGRILWLKGLEKGVNHFCPHHSMRRYIYIHGTEKDFLKTPVSEGCINISNESLNDLCNKTPTYCKVYITEC